MRPRFASLGSLFLIIVGASFVATGAWTHNAGNLLFTILFIWILGIFPIYAGVLGMYQALSRRKEAENEPYGKPFLLINIIAVIPLLIVVSLLTSSLIPGIAEEEPGGRTLLAFGIIVLPMLVMSWVLRRVIRIHIKKLGE